MISLKSFNDIKSNINAVLPKDKLNFYLFVGSGVVAGCVVYVTAKVYLNHRKYSHIPGPPNKGFLGFYLGQAGKLFECLETGNLFCDVFTESVQKYGTTVKFNVLDSTIVNTVDPEAIKEILVNENFQKNVQVYNTVAYPLGQRLLGTSMVVDTNHESWKKKRSIFNPAFHRQELKSYMNEFNSTADILIEKLRKYADGKTLVKLHNEIGFAAMDMISNIAFGVPLDALSDPNNKLGHYVKYCLETAQIFLFNPFAKFNPRKWNQIKQFKKTLKEFRQYAREQIQNRMDQIKNGETVRNDILTSILKSQETTNFDMENMIDEFITFFFAGHETTASTLGFFFLEVCRNQEIYEKLKQEVDTVLGAKSEVSYDDLNKLEYMSCAFKETLRLWPPGATFSRVATKDLTVNGLKIPKGSWISVSPYSSQRCEKHFPEPTKFCPERFMDQSENHNINPYTYFPFSLGLRNCIGQVFAQFEAKVIISKIVQNFDIVLDSTQSFGATEAFSIKPKDGTRCYLSLRK